MNLSLKRDRARRIAKGEDVWSDDDGRDPDDLDYDYSGVVETDEEAERERREEFAKSLGSSGGPDLDFEEIWKDDREEDPEIEYDYSGITKSPREKERERKAEATAEAVVAELDRRGLTDAAGGGDDADDADDADANRTPDSSTAVEKTADLLVEFEEGVRDLKRARSVRTLAKKYVADGGDPADSMAEVFRWVNHHSGASIKVEDGSVIVEDPA